MKYGRLRTMRGQIEVVGGGVGRKSLITADGLINYGLKIEKFQVWAVDPADSFVSILSCHQIYIETALQYCGCSTGDLCLLLRLGGRCCSKGSSYRKGILCCHLQRNSQAPGRWQSGDRISETDCDSN